MDDCKPLQVLLVEDEDLIRLMAMGTPIERVAVTITVMGVEQVRDRGPLIGLAIVELDIAGVVLTLQGVQVFRLRDGSLTCRSPQFRRSNGMWTSAAVLPPDLAEALGVEVLAHLRSPKVP